MSHLCIDFNIIPQDLDIFIKSENDWLFSKILRHGRKKDLDRMIKTKNEYVLSKIIDNQYEEHLQLLSHHHYSDIRNFTKNTLIEYNL